MKRLGKRLAVLMPARLALHLRRRASPTNMSLLVRLTQIQACQNSIHLEKIPVPSSMTGKQSTIRLSSLNTSMGTRSDRKLLPEKFSDRIEVKRWEALGDGIADATVAISHDERRPEPKRHGC